MRHLLIAIAVVGALALTACGDDDGSSTDGGGAVSTAPVEGATVLVDTAGHTLYTSDLEANGKVACTRECTAIWKPVTTGGAAPPSVDGAELGVVDRADGAQQLSFEGRPLYSFTQEGPGELTGEVTDSFGGRTFKWSAAVVSGMATEPAEDGESGPAGGYGGY